MKRSTVIDDQRKREKLNKTLRKTTIFKKAKELSTLCGVDVALIFYDSGEQTPESWSSRPDGVSVIKKYLSVTNQPQIALPRIQPLDIVDEECRAVRDREFINNLGFEDLNGFASLLAAKIENLNQRINVLREADVGQLQFTDTTNELNVDDFEFTFDDLDCLELNDLGFQNITSDDHLLRQPPSDLPSPSVLGNVDFTFDGLESFSLDDLEFGMTSATDQVQVESPSVYGGVDLGFDGVKGFSLDDLVFGTTSATDQVQLESPSVYGGVDLSFDGVKGFSLDDLVFGTTSATDQVEEGSPLVYDSLGNLEFVDDDVDWMNALMTS